MTKTVIVTGTSRVGSSPLMEILRILGISIIGATEPKERVRGYVNGYHETGPFVLFQKKMLEKAGCGWHNPKKEKEFYKAWKDYKETLERIIEENKKEPIWAFKALQIPLFPEVLKSFSNLFLIIMIRNPKDVDLSQRKQSQVFSKMPKEYGIKLWAIYYFRLLRFLSRNRIPFLLINFDDLIDQPEKEIEKLKEFLELSISEKQRKNALSSIKKEFRHFKGNK